MFVMVVLSYMQVETLKTELIGRINTLLVFTSVLSKVTVRTFVRHLPLPSRPRVALLRISPLLPQSVSLGIIANYLWLWDIYRVSKKRTFT